MPYEITRGAGCSDSKPYAVVKQGSGERIACHETEESAKQQMAALYANEKESHVKTAIKRENGIDFPPRDYAFVPDPLAPTTWRLRLSDTPGEISVEMLNRAAAALSPAGFRGNRVDIPPGALSSVKRRLLAEYRRLGIDERQIPNSVKELATAADQGSMQVWKEAKTGRYRWLAIYSNNYRDDDNPPEIISQKSHENFVEMVDEGVVDYPEVWLWHVPGTAWGKADWLAYSDGFALASGYVYAGKEHIAQNLAKDKGLMVSHGMPKPLLVYDPHDPSTILFHVTTEISPLPHAKAANKLTGFAVLKGENLMPVPEKKKSWLREVGVPDDELARLDDSLKALADAAHAAGIDSKEEGEPEEEIETEVVEAAVEEADASEPEPEVKAADEEMMEEEEMPPKPKRKRKEAETPVPVVADVPLVNYTTKEEVAGALTEVFVPIMDTLRAMSEQVATMSKELAETRQELRAMKATDEEKIAATKELTPTLSIADILAQNVIGKEAAKVDKRTTLGKDAPVEKEAPAAPGFTPIPMLNGLIQGARSS